MDILWSVIAVIVLRPLRLIGFQFVSAPARLFFFAAVSCDKRSFRCLEIYELALFESDIKFY